MKDYELLDMIGEVNEDYVLAADSNVIKPRFRWKDWAVTAACVALLVSVWPVTRMWAHKRMDTNGNESMVTADSAPEAPEATEVIRHSFTVVEDGGIMTARGDTETVKGGPTADAEDEEAVPEPAAAAGVGSSSEKDSDVGSDEVDGIYDEVGADAPVQEAALWYDALLRTWRLEESPEWYGGAWIEEDQLLAVAIVDGFHTPELEADLLESAGEGAVIRFSTVKYSMEFLNGLMEPAVRALDGMDLYAGVGVDVVNNCLGVDIYGGEVIPDEVLIQLAHLDPDGDAIRVQLFINTVSVADDEWVKDPEPPVADDTVAHVYGGAWVGEEGVSATRDKQDVPAVISLPPGEQSRPAHTEEGLTAEDVLRLGTEDMPQH